MGGAEVEAFLTMLANERRVSASTHKQALSALMFLYREVLDQDLPWLAEIGRPAQRKRIPGVLTKEEVGSLFALMHGEEKLLAQLLYGTGMRLMEGLSLRVKDVDFSRRTILVRKGKGGKDRVVMLPRSMETPLREQLSRSRALWDADRRSGFGGVQMPHALENKYPRAGESWAWHWIFPAGALSTDPASGGKAHVGDTIDLVVSNGNVTLPDVTGQSIGAATSLLGESDLGLTPKPQADPTCPTEPGTLVHTQSLPPGEVPQGSTVILTYCTGTS